VSVHLDERADLISLSLLKKEEKFLNFVKTKFIMKSITSTLKLERSLQPFFSEPLFSHLNPATAEANNSLIFGCLFFLLNEKRKLV